MGTHRGPGITAQGQEEPERETQGDAEETPAGTPEADLFPACVRFDIVAFFFLWRWTATVWIICWGLLIGICVFMHFKSMSTTGFTDKVFAVCYGEACSVRLFCTLITFSELPHVDMWNFWGGTMHSQISTNRCCQSKIALTFLTILLAWMKQEKMLVNRNCVRWVRGKTILPQIGSIRPVC